MTLSATTSPATGQAGTTSINITGSGFPSGTIPPANVTITLTPSVSGPPSATTTASAVTTILGPVRRVTFQIPASVVVSSATIYQVSIAGTTSTGMTFTSANTSALTVLPATLVDSFTSDSSLNTTLWTTNSQFLESLAAASSSPPASFVTPQLSFSSSGMEMTGVDGYFQTAGIQSLMTFTPPFTVQANVMGTEATGNPFELFLASSDLSQFLTVSGNLNSANGGYYGIWTTAPNISQLWQLGEQLQPATLAALNVEYTINISVNMQGGATVIVQNSNGTLFGSASNLQVGTGPFYLVLGQREGAPNLPPGPNVAYWNNVSVNQPQPANIDGVMNTVQPDTVSVCNYYSTSAPTSTSCPANGNTCEKGGSSCFSIQQNFWVATPADRSNPSYWFQNGVLLENVSGAWKYNQEYCYHPYSTAGEVPCPKSTGWNPVPGSPSSIPAVQLSATITDGAVSLTTSLGGQGVNTYSPGTACFPILPCPLSVPSGSYIVGAPSSVVTAGNPFYAPEVLLVGERTVKSGSTFEPYTAVFSPATSGSVTSAVLVSGVWQSPRATVAEESGKCTDTGETGYGLLWLVNVYNPSLVRFAATGSSSPNAQDGIKYVYGPRSTGLSACSQP